MWCAARRRLLACLFGYRPAQGGAEAPDLNFQFWDLDGILCDSVEAVGTAILLLKQELPPLQLDLDLQNCNVFLPNVHSVQHFGLEGIPPVDFFIRPNVSWSADRKRRPHSPPHRGGSQQTSDRLEEGKP